MPLTTPAQLNRSATCLKTFDASAHESRYGIDAVWGLTEIEPTAKDLDDGLLACTFETACFEQVRPDFVVKEGQKIGMVIRNDMGPVTSDQANVSPKLKQR